VTAGRPPLPPGAGDVHGSPRSTGEEPANRLAAGIRRLTDLLVCRPLPDPALQEAADTVATVVARLEEVAGPGRRPREHPRPGQHPQDFFSTSPVIGYANPLAAPVDVWAATGDDGLRELRGRARFGCAYEGPPGCVHGGVIAQLFDELLGSAAILGGHPGMTGTLTIRYRRPTPVLTWLDLQARIIGIEGRKGRLWGAIRHDGVCTAEAEGVFVLVPQRLRNEMVAAGGAPPADGIEEGADQSARWTPSQ
jgi:acyl-coenzyme A thioesterase PaaI-like protein